MCAAAINYYPDGEDPVMNTLIASGSADSAVCIWKRADPTGIVIYGTSVHQSLWQSGCGS